MSEQKSSGFDRPTYGNIIIPSNTGFWGFPKDLSNMAITCVVGAFLSQIILGMINQNLAIFSTALIVFSGIVTIIYRIRRGKFGRYKYQEQRLKKKFLKAKKAGKTEYRPGPASELPDGSYRAPGPLMATELKDWRSSSGDCWAMLWNGDVPERFGSLFPLVGYSCEIRMILTIWSLHGLLFIDKPVFREQSYRLLCPRSLLQIVGIGCRWLSIICASMRAGKK